VGTPKERGIVTTEPLDLDVIRPWFTLCGPCDAGLPMACTCPQGDPRPIVAKLVAEVERLRADRTVERRRNAARLCRTIARRIPHMAPNAAMQWLLDTAADFEQAAG
jgi:hypothetical protein